MKNYLITLLMISLGYGHAQDCSVTGLEESLVKQLVDKQFGNLIGTQSNNIIGNFASLDLKETEVNFAGNIVFDNGSMLGIKAKGGVSDGFLPIFNNSKLNSKLGLDIQYNSLNFKRNNRSIQYENNECVKYQNSIRKINNEYELKKIQIEMYQDRTLLEIEIKKISEEVGALETKLALLSGLSRDSLGVEIKKKEQELIFMKNQLNNLPDIASELNELENWKTSEILKAKSEMKINGFGFGWFSIGYGLNTNSFKLFDGTMPFDEQISKKFYASHSVKLQYSYYKKSQASYESFFFTVNSTFSIGDNFSSLSKVEINETSNYGPNSNDRSITNKYNAYLGDYSKDLKSVSLNGDLYWFLFDNNKGAIHFYPTHEMTEGLKPSTNLGFGFLMAFKSEEKETNIVNSEIYINLTDVFDNGNSSEPVFSRSNFGLRFAFPINFNTK